MNSPKVGDPRPQGRPRGFDRDEALDRAVRVFWAMGFEGASLDDLTAAMGINRSSLYQAFGDKRSLFIEAIARYGATVGSAGPASLLASEGTLRAALTKFFDVVVDNATLGDGPRGCFVTCTLPEVAEGDPEFREQLSTICRSADDLLAQRFQQAIAEGELPTSASPEALATLTTSLMHSLSLRARSGASRADLKRLAQDCIAILAPVG